MKSFISEQETGEAIEQQISSYPMPLNWRLVTLEEIALEVGSGITPRGGEESYQQSGIALVRSQNVLMNKLSLKNIAFISPETHQSMIRSAITPGDVLLNITGASIGRVAIVPDILKVANVNQHVCKIRLRPTAFPNFISYFLSSARGQSQILGSQFGTTRQGLNYGNVRALRIPLPPLPEQRAIAHILQVVQNALQARCKELELERERKAALMQYLFTHGMRGEATKQTEIGEIPQNWELTSLGKACMIRYGLGQPPQKDDAGIPMIRATDIKNGHIVTNAVMKVKREAIPEERACFLQKGDIIVVRSGAYAGDVAMYKGHWEKAIAGYDLVVTPKAKDVESPFLTYYLQGETNQRYFRSQRDRSAQPHINADQLSNALIPLPFKNGSIDGEEQEEISQILMICDSKIAALEKEIAFQEELFRALLEELMSGRLSALPLVE